MKERRETVWTVHLSESFRTIKVEVLVGIWWKKRNRGVEDDNKFTGRGKGSGDNTGRVTYGTEERPGIVGTGSSVSPEQLCV